MEARAATTAPRIDFRAGNPAPSRRRDAHDASGRLPLLAARTPQSWHFQRRFAARRASESGAHAHTQTLNAERNVRASVPLGTPGTEVQASAAPSSGPRARASDRARVSVVRVCVRGGISVRLMAGDDGPSIGLLGSGADGAGGAGHGSVARCRAVLPRTPEWPPAAPKMPSKVMFLLRVKAAVRTAVDSDDPAPRGRASPGAGPMSGCGSAEGCSFSTYFLQNEIWIQQSNQPWGWVRGFDCPSRARFFLWGPTARMV